MNQTILYNELNDIIEVAEERIRVFHQTRKKIDGFTCVIKALLNKKTGQQCVDELYKVSEDLKDVFGIFVIFEKNNNKYFTGIMRDYLYAYESYLKCATIASEKRLDIQELILQATKNKASKESSNIMVAMKKEMETLQNECLDKARKFNSIANEIKILQKKRFEKDDKSMWV